MGNVYKSGNLSVSHLRFYAPKAKADSLSPEESESLKAFKAQPELMQRPRSPYSEPHHEVPSTSRLESL